MRTSAPPAAGDEDLKQDLSISVKHHYHWMLGNGEAGAIATGANWDNATERRHRQPVC